MNFNDDLIPIKGDASFRKFFRKKKNKKSTIIVYSGKDKKKNLLNYDAVNKILLKKKISAPKLISESYNKNFIEIKDLGKKTLFDILKNKKKNNYKTYKKILIFLNKLQKIKVKKIKNFKNKIYKIPKYKNSSLLKESNLFLEWYVPSVINKKKKIKINNQLKNIIKALIKKIIYPNDIFVHRDFHVSNLMINKQTISIIDSQDAVYGNISYDLASLIDDVRFKTSNSFKQNIYRYYLKINKNKINFNKFKNDFDILSVLRNLKIIGIFTRLAKRDKKKQYLKLIPYCWELVELRINNNIIFKDLKNCLDKNFSKKIRKIK
tara:strand:+ start:698 stop:1660 length:963 start_codon:yes stop_codon:yes gene_type:complete